MSADKRGHDDRRHKATFPLSLDSLRGSRYFFRRKIDQDRYIYVDRYSYRAVFAILTIIFLSSADALLTLNLINLGTVREFNPVMDYLLSYGATSFIVVKSLITSVCVLVALIFKNHRLWNWRVQVKNVLSGVLGMYAVLIIYELGLLYLSV